MQLRLRSRSSHRSTVPAYPPLPPTRASARLRSHTDGHLPLSPASAPPIITRPIFVDAFFQAAATGDMATLRDLLSACHADMQDSTGTTPLFIASKNGCADAVAFLLPHANPNLATQSGATPLFIASKHGHVDIVKQLLPVVNVDLHTDTGTTALHVAAQYNFPKIVAALMERVDVNATTKSGATALFLACEHGHEAVVRQLVRRANVNLAKGKITPLHVAAQNGLTVIVHYLILDANINCQRKDGATPLFLAAERGHHGIVDLLLSENADPNLATSEGYTPLSIACATQQLNIIQELLDADADVNMQPEDGASPLYTAAKLGHADVVRLLLRTAHVDVNLARYDGATPLFTACKHGNVQVVQLLVEKADVNMALLTGVTPLAIAAAYGRLDIVQLLLTKGADAHVADHEFRMTALLRAAKNGHVSCVQTLLPVSSVNVASTDGETALHVATRVAIKTKHLSTMEALMCQADVNAATIEGLTPLILAAQSGSAEVVAFLLTHGANTDKQTDTGATALHLASQYGHVDVVGQLLDAGANETIVANDLSTPLFIAAHFGHVKVLRILIKKGSGVNAPRYDHATPLLIAARHGHVNAVRLLLEHADPNIATENGSTALYVAARDGHFKIVQMLMDKADVNKQTHSGVTALFAAAQKGHVNIVALLMTTADVNVARNDGATPLFVAAEAGHLKIVQLLLTTKVNANLANERGDTPLHIACERGRHKIVAVLLNKSNMKTTNEAGMTALDVATDNRNPAVIRVWNEYMAVDAALAAIKKESLSWNHPFENGMSVLLLAARCGRIVIAKRAMGAGCDVAHTDNDGNTALMWAARNGHLKMVQQLLEHKPTTSAPTPTAPPTKQLLNRCMSTQSESSDSSMTARTPGRRGSLRLSDVAKLPVRMRRENNPVNLRNHDDWSPIQEALSAKQYEIAVLLIAKDCEWHIHHSDKLLVEYLAPHLTTEVATKVLLRDLPIEVLPDGGVVEREAQSFSWTTFLDTSLAVDADVRVATVRAIFNHKTFRHVQNKHDLRRELAYSKDCHGRDALHLTDAATRQVFKEELFFCARYELSTGPPIHVSDSSVVVHAFDYGIFKQVFEMRAVHGQWLDADGMLACGQVLGMYPTEHDRSDTKNLMDEYHFCDRNHDGRISEAEFLRYCEEKFGGKLKVALKFIQHADEYDREVRMRAVVGNDAVLELLPAVDPTLFHTHVGDLKLAGNLSMAKYPHVLVMPAADRSLEDIYLKEKPDDNQIRSMLQHVAKALVALHDKKIVHGDVKKHNVVRVHGALQLIDLDSAVSVHEYSGHKFSSGLLPPEMFYELQDDAERGMFETYWADHKTLDTTTWHKVKPRGSWVVKSFDKTSGRDLDLLPYKLEFAQHAMDEWAFGCMVYQMYSGEELVPTDTHQDVVGGCISRAGTWTDAELHDVVEAKITNRLARHLVQRLLVVDPADRLRLKKMLKFHPYFNVSVDAYASREAFEVDVAKKLDAFKDFLKSNSEHLEQIEKDLHGLSIGVQQMQEDLHLVVELSDAHVAQLTQVKIDLLRGIYDATDVTVPTSFVVLPFKRLDLAPDEADAAQRAQAIGDFFSWWNHVVAAIVEGIKHGDVVGTFAKLMGASIHGPPLYLYLIDEVSGEPVEEMDDNSVYPIQLDTVSETFQAFLQSNLPLIQSGFNLLKGANDVATCLRAFGVPHMDKPALRHIESMLEKTSGTFTLHEFGLLDQMAATSIEKGGERTERARGAALRQLEAFFDTYDSHRTFAGLERIYAADGTALWTSPGTAKDLVAKARHGNSLVGRRLTLESQEMVAAA
ncbi:Aste57867_23150 [Aphanomyces stellatus]|uniref:Aste57867_23150 protein n=1 Tax=Aphanomyces stellatus TaxID=120398 RepID=A0A485LM56_9STRA|nr:hypothetical protein As57867_023079 [Aphanomyces stellatus]VFT99798.1 Aste57867_23150 [Aphanomyces stellatus]